MDSSRLQAQLRFVVEIDKLKRVLRRTTLMDATRNENSAEHSWHLALMAVLLEEYVPEPADLARVVRMVLVHDIVEIDAGDTFCYDPDANLDKTQREQLAAERIFGLLPPDQAHEMKALWEEFEEARTPDARFANALDRLQPLLHNLHTGGGTWRIHGIAHDQVLERMRPIQAAMPALWPFVEDSLARAAEEGWVR
jgi:putative hydrolase of HD superfamily